MPPSLSCLPRLLPSFHTRSPSGHPAIAVVTCIRALRRTDPLEWRWRGVMAGWAEEHVTSTTWWNGWSHLVVNDVLPDRETVGWRLAASEGFPTPGSDELVVFEGYFYRGFGYQVHPFLNSLINYYGISLCNLGPNSIVHVAIFIHFYEAYLDILSHFDLFHHFFRLKTVGGTESRIVGNVYLQLRDGTATQYITTLLNTNVKYWAQRWFYKPQAQERVIACDVDQILRSNARWSKRPKVREIFQLIDRRRLDGIIVASNFILCRVQPCKERAHLGFRVLGGRSWNAWSPRGYRPGRSEATGHFIVFNLVKCRRIKDPQRSVTMGNLPPQVWITFFVPQLLYSSIFTCSLCSWRVVGRNKLCTSCQFHRGTGRWE
jgi:hypothetical protein